MCVVRSNKCCLRNVLRVLVCFIVFVVVVCRRKCCVVKYCPLSPFSVPAQPKKKVETHVRRPTYLISSPSTQSDLGSRLILQQNYSPVPVWPVLPSPLLSPQLLLRTHNSMSNWLVFAPGLVSPKMCIALNCCCCCCICSAVLTAKTSPNGQDALIRRFVGLVGGGGGTPPPNGD